MSKVRTDNSHFHEKVNLRCSLLPEKRHLRVLDCFAGNQRIWNEVKRRRKEGKRIDVLSIDSKKNLDTRVYLVGNNLKFLKSFDLNSFDIIDLDAYGIPHKQLSLIFEKDYHGLVFGTFIQSLFGRLDKKMLLELGYTRKMIDKIPTLFDRNGWEKFKGFLSLHGITNISFITPDRKKYYFCFVI
jgi:hypothetical protein